MAVLQVRAMAAEVGSYQEQLAALHAEMLTMRAFESALSHS